MAQEATFKIKISVEPETVEKTAEIVSELESDRLRRLCDL